MGGRDAGSEQHVCEPGTWRRLTLDDVEASIGERFRVQVDTHADCLAVRDGTLSLSYGELDDWASSVAGALEDTGVASGSRVVQLLDQGADSVAAMLGTLLAGALHVPLDPDEPDARLASLLDRVGPHAIVTDDAGAARVAGLGVMTPVVPPGRGRSAARPPAQTAGPDDLATIYFTSGSTGIPKGVLDRHRNIVHNALRYTLALDVSPADRLSLVQPPFSSAVMSSIFTALLNGAALFPYRLDAERLGSLAGWVRSERITIYHSVPSILRRALAFGGALPHVRVVRLEGDRAYGQEMATWRRALRPGTLVANGLGTTETGLCRQLRVPVEADVADGIMPVGDPVTDMDVTIVDEDGAPVPEGGVGEIAVSSRYLASGYLDDAVSTAAAFVADPARPGFRTYRTGDLGRLRPDGCLEYLGRRDGHAKVLGHRVEPAEVEQALATVPGVDAVAVRIVEDLPGEGRVVAWVVADAGTGEHSLRAAAERLLPPWMRPARYVRVGALPLASTGKVDRRALTEPPVADPPTPGTGEGLEHRVMAVVRGVLGKPIDRDDDFFRSGGDSLGAVDVVLALEAETGRRLPISLVLAEPTVARLTAALAAAPGSGERSLARLSGSGGGLPVVLLPGHDRHSLAYASLASHLSLARPVLVADASTPVDDGPGDPFEAVARRHVGAIRDARLDGGYLLGGFCFGAAMAYEVARQMMDTGDGPVGLYLLGIAPYDLPDLVPPDALERWTRSTAPLGTLGHTARLVRALASPVGRAFVADRVLQAGRTAREVTTRAGRERRRTRDRRASAIHPFAGQYRGPALDLPVTVILSSWRLTTYCTDPVALWAGIGSTVDVHVIPGVGRMMLSEPMVGSVAAIMTRSPGSGPRDAR